MATKRKTSRTPRRPNGRPPGGDGINWNAAFAYYAALGPGARTYGQVAEKFNAGIRTVQRRAAADRWRELCVAIDEETRLRDSENIVRELAKRNEDTIRIVEASRSAYATFLSRGGHPSGSELAQLLRVEQLIGGKPTDRVDGFVASELGGLSAEELDRDAGQLAEAIATAKNGNGNGHAAAAA